MQGKVSSELCSLWGASLDRVRGGGGVQAFLFLHGFHSVGAWIVRVGLVCPDHFRGRVQPGVHA